MPYPQSAESIAHSEFTPLESPIFDGGDAEKNVGFTEDGRGQSPIFPSKDPSVHDSS
jgi:hypothetical protein